jgi:hypothetical protein
VQIVVQSFYTVENLAYGFQEIEVFEENAGKGRILIHLWENKLPL